MKLMDQVRMALRRGHYSPRTEEVYCRWILRYIRFHGTRHPRELGHDELIKFLDHLAVERRVAASTQNQALNRLVGEWVPLSMSICRHGSAFPR